MEAGRKLDHLIAEKVFERDPLDARQGLHANGDLEYSWGYPLGHDTAPAYSTDIAAAWTVVEKMTDPTSTGGKLIGDFPVATRFAYHFMNCYLWSMTAAEAAHKICEVALKSFEIAINETTPKETTVE